MAAWGQVHVDEPLHLDELGLGGDGSTMNYKVAHHYKVVLQSCKFACVCFEHTYIYIYIYIYIYRYIHCFVCMYVCMYVCIVLYCIVLYCIVMSCHVMSCHVM